MKSKTIAAIAVATILSASSASAFTINTTFDPSWSSAPAGATADINYAAQLLGSLFTNRAAVNIDFGWGEVGGNALAGNAGGATSVQMAEANTLQQTQYLYNQYLSANPQNSVMASVLSHLPASVTNSNPNGSSLIYLPAAQLAALLNIASTYTDAWVGFGTGLSWNFSTTNGAGGEYDFVGAALHEITHALGRVGYEFAGTPFLTTYDLTRYNCGATTLNSTQSSPACFSYNGGVTDLATFSPTADSADWQTTAATINSPNTAYIGTGGLFNTLAPVDVATMESLGYTTKAASVPIMGSIALLFVAGVAMFLTGVRLRNRGEK